jgi:hypothetical protein
MRRSGGNGPASLLGCGAALCALLLAGCGSNPLLQMAGSNYAPLKVGDTWTYQAPAPNGGYQDVVSIVGPVTTQGGRQAYSVLVTSSTNGTASPASKYYMNLQSGSLDVLDSVADTAASWALDRRLPYEPGDSWPAPVFLPAVNPVAWTSGATTDAWSLQAQAPGVSQTATVSTTIAAVTTPLGKFQSCYEIDTQITDGNGDIEGGTAVWVAPNVGDVQYASLAAITGNQTVTLQLVSYHLQ